MKDWTPDREERCSAVIRRTDLLPAARLLYTALDDCEAPIAIAALASEVGMSPRTARRLMRDLEVAGLVEAQQLLRPEAAVKLLCEKPSIGGLAIGEAVCSWCAVRTAVLERHHYPIPRSKGGTETVSICPNCHTEYHFLTQFTYGVIDGKS